MRKIGLDQLKKCVSRKYNLLEFLAMLQITRESAASVQTIDPAQYQGWEKIPLNKKFALVKDIQKRADLEGIDLKDFINLLLPIAAYCYDPVATCVKDIKTKYPDFFALCNRAGLNPQEDKSLNNRMLKSFYSSFFTRMRKLKKTKQEKGQNNG
jgi:hypothetical protein